MASSYPNGLDALTTTHQDSVGEVIHATDVNNLADAVNKIEAELGILPKGTFSSVSAKLGALFYGQVTTTQRDAIAQGNRPPGLIVFNTTTNRYEFNSGSDVTPTWSPVGPAGPWGPTDLTSAVSVIPVGGIIDWPWAAGSVPSWAALPAGQAISRSTFSALFTLANTTGLTVYGSGDGSTSFNVPDYRGRFGVGKDDMGGTAAGRITAAISGVAGTTLGAVFGSEGITLTTAQLPAHNHGITGTPGLSDPGHAHNIAGYGGGSGGLNGITFNGGTAVNQTSGVVFTATTGISVSAGSLGTSNAGSGSVHQNTQPSIVVNKIIRVS